MTHREFFYLVSNMRQAQRDYFQCRTPERLRACKWLEGQVDREIMRVKDILALETSNDKKYSYDYKQ